MNRSRTIRRGGVVAAAAALVAVARSPSARRRVRHTCSRCATGCRRMEGRAQGASYRFAGRAPDPMVTDDILADRARSELGRLQRRLDVPHLHVTVRGHVAELHGEVATERDVDAVERRLLRVSGIWGVRSHLHVGLARGDTPPSLGRGHVHPSPLFTELVHGAQQWGLNRCIAERAVRAVVHTFAERLPAGERRHLASHLPADVRSMLGPPNGHARPRLHHVGDFVSVAAARAGLDERTTGPVAEGILGTLRSRIPEEVRDIAAVLPADLRAWWQDAVPT